MGVPRRASTLLVVSGQSRGYPAQGRYANTMNTDHFQIARRLVVMLVAVIAVGQLVIAQEIVRPIEASDVQLIGPIMIGRQGFDLRASGRVVANEEIRERYETALQSRIQSTVRLYGLSEEQKKKQHVAGRGDIQRLIDRAIEARKREPLPPGVANEFPPAIQDAPRPPLTTSGGLFGEGSLFAKTLKTTVTKEQTSRYENAVRAASPHQPPTLQ